MPLRRKGGIWVAEQRSSDAGGGGCARWLGCEPLTVKLPGALYGCKHELLRSSIREYCGCDARTNTHIQCIQEQQAPTTSRARRAGTCFWISRCQPSMNNERRFVRRVDMMSRRLSLWTIIRCEAVLIVQLSRRLTGMRATTSSNPATKAACTCHHNTTSAARSCRGKEMSACIDTNMLGTCRASIDTRACRCPAHSPRTDALLCPQVPAAVTFWNNTVQTVPCVYSVATQMLETTGNNSVVTSSVPYQKYCTPRLKLDAEQGGAVPAENCWRTNAGLRRYRARGACMIVPAARMDILLT